MHDDWTSKRIGSSNIFNAFFEQVRALALHPELYMFASASTDNIKQWKCPKGEFIQNLSGHNAIVNALACNQVRKNNVSLLTRL